MIRILDPTHEAPPELAKPAPRPRTLAGKTVGILSNGKEGTRQFFEQLASELRREIAIAEVIVRVKSSYSAPAETQLLDEASQWAAVITGVGD